MNNLAGKLRRDNKRILEGRLIRDPASAQTSYEKAVLDNLTPGPGLRKGGQWKLNSDRPRQEKYDDEGNKIDDDETIGPKKGWGGFPLQPAANEESTLKTDLSECRVI